MREHRVTMKIFGRGTLMNNGTGKMSNKVLLELLLLVVCILAKSVYCHSRQQQQVLGSSTHEWYKQRQQYDHQFSGRPPSLDQQQHVIPWSLKTVEPSSSSAQGRENRLDPHEVLPQRSRLILKRQSEQGDEFNSDYPIASGRASQLWKHQSNVSHPTTNPMVGAGSNDVCSDRLCYGLPMGCLRDRENHSQMSGSRCSVLVTSKQLIDPYRPVARDIHFELVALPVPGQSNYAAVGFSETGRMSGLVSECLQYRDANTKLQIITLSHSYNVPGAYSNIPVTILSGIKNLGVSFENGYYQCRWVVESAVEFTYEEPSGQIVNRREDLGYKNYHILLASGGYDERTNIKSIHTDRISSMGPVSLAQIGRVQSLGSPILIRIHGSLMIAIWVGLVTISVLLARYYKNEWASSKINDTAIWFVLHRAFMLIAWFGSIIAVIFAYMYTEAYHPGVHQISGTTCLVLSTIQALGGLLRPSPESSRRVFFNWTHFLCGNLGYLCAITSIVTAAFLAPAHLPPSYIWVVVAFVTFYALTHFIMTIHQYIVHKSSKISITPMSDLSDANSANTYSTCGFVADSYPKELNSTFRQVMLGILVTIIVIFIVLLMSLVAGTTRTAG